MTGLATAATLRAQVMTLRDCMAYAISNSTKMRIQQADVNDARIDRRNAILAVFLPSINSGTSASYSFGRNIDPETNTYINTVSFSNGYNLSASMTLFNGFSAVNNLKISQTALKMGQTREKQTEADLCLAVMEAYYNVLYYQQMAEAQERQAAVAERLLEKASREEALGLKSHSDVIQLEADLADRRYDLVRSRNMLDDQRVKLEDLLFWPVGEPLVIAEEMPDQVGHDAVPGVTSGSALNLQTGNSVTPGWTGDPFPEEALEAALAHNPAVQLAAWSVENARLDLKTARWQLLPTVSLGGGWSTSYYSFQGTQQVPYWDLLRRNGGEYVSLSVSIPIFNRLSRQSNIARKRSALARAEANYDQTQRDVASEIRRAIQDCDGAAAAFEQADRKAAVQEEAYAMHTRKLEEGLISPLEYQTAANNYLRAGTDRLNSLYQYLIKLAVVRYYNGIDYINQ